MPLRPDQSTSSSASLVLPMPASPRIRNSRVRPAAAARHALSSALPFRLAADERIDGGARRRRDHGRRSVQIENLAVGDARRGARLDPELLLQHRRALLIEVQRRGALAAARVTTHERAPGLFVERIEPEQLLRVLDRVPEGAIVFEEVDQTRQDLLRALAETFAVGVNPLAGALGQQVALVETCRLAAGQRRSPSRPRSAAASNAIRSTMAPGLVAPGQRARAGVDERVQLRPAFPQVVQLAAEIGQRLDVARFRPEGAGDALTRNRSAARHAERERR